MMLFLFKNFLQIKTQILTLMPTRKREKNLQKREHKTEQQRIRKILSEFLKKLSQVSQSTIGNSTVKYCIF